MAYFPSPESCPCSAPPTLPWDTAPQKEWPAPTQYLLGISVCHH